MKLKLLSAALICALCIGNAHAESLQATQATQAELDARQAEAASRQAQAASRQAEAQARARERDAQAEIMAAQMKVDERSKHAPLSDRDELAMAALEGLMSAPDARVLPILQKVLKGNHSDVVKARALFVLSQIGLDEAQLTLLEFVRNSKGDLQEEAVRSVGIGGNTKSLEALLPLSQSADDSLRKQILEAFLIADRKDLVMKLAQSAKTEDEAEQAIHTLSAMGAVAELRALGAQGKYTDSLIEAYAISGDLQSLLRIAQSDSDSGVREDAIQRIGIINGKAARQALQDIYREVKEPQLKEAALQGMLISGDQKGVLALYRATQNIQEKRSLLRTLSMMGGDAALEAIDAALEGNAP